MTLIIDAWFIALKTLQPNRQAEFAKFTIGKELRGGGGDILIFLPRRGSDVGMDLTADSGERD